MIVQSLNRFSGIVLSSHSLILTNGIFHQVWHNQVLRFHSKKYFEGSLIAEDRHKNLSVKLKIFSYSTVLTYVLGAQKNCLIETDWKCKNYTSVNEIYY